MSAAEDECIDSRAHQFPKIAFDNLISDTIVEPAFLDKRDQHGTRLTGHADLGIDRLNRPFISATVNSGTSSDYSNVTIASRFNRRLCTGCDYANHWDFQDAEWQGQKRYYKPRQ